MNRSSLLTVSLLLFSAACFGQTSQTDSQTLLALLSEVRQLRQDMRVTIIAAQRAQVLIYRLQAQEADVARESQRLDEAREKLGRTQDRRKHETAELKMVEDFIANTENSATQRKQWEDNRPPELKAELESLASDEQQNQSREIEAKQQLRAEEVRLNDLREQLDRLDKTLENANR